MKKFKALLALLPLLLTSCTTTTKYTKEDISRLTVYYIMEMYGEQHDTYYTDGYEAFEVEIKENEGKIDSLIVTYKKKNKDAKTRDYSNQYPRYIITKR